jgi:hypothetical protein
MGEGLIYPAGSCVGKRDLNSLVESLYVRSPEKVRCPRDVVQDVKLRRCVVAERNAQRPMGATVKEAPALAEKAGRGERGS